MKALVEKYGRDLYDFSDVVYEGPKRKVTIRCIIHDTKFEAVPYRLLVGLDKCPVCAKESQHLGMIGNLDKFIQKSKEIYGEDAFDYSRAVYLDQMTPLWLKCNKHDEWFQVKPKVHYKEASGCPICAKEWNDELNKSRRLTNEEFISMMEERHPGEFTYEHTHYIDHGHPVTITCKIHGDFEANPNDLLSKFSGCPKCSLSDLEKDVSDLLYNNNIKSVYGAHFDWLTTGKKGGNLELDFYIPSMNVAIECQGEQHFRSIGFFGGDESFINLQERDALKKKLCDEHNIPLLYYANYEYDFPYQVYTDTTSLYNAILDASNAYNQGMAVSNTIQSVRNLTRNSFDVSTFMSADDVALNEANYQKKLAEAEVTTVTEEISCSCSSCSSTQPTQQQPVYRPTSFTTRVPIGNSYPLF